MKAENGFIFINNEKTGELYPRIAYNLEKKSEIDFARCSETIINTVFQTGKSILSSDAAQDDRFVGAKSIIYENIRSVMCVPLRVHDKILGVLEIDTRKVVGGFTVDDLEILSVIAGHIAECMENARLYSDLKKAHDKLQDIDDIKTKMITLVGHELATPLTIIDQYAVLLKDKLFGDITEKQHKVLEVMCSRVAKLKKIISDVSKVSKSPVSYKNLKSAQEEFEINALISETVSDLQPLIDGRNQNLSMNLKAKDIYVFASREGINEVITNIAVNAIKYTPNGGHIEIKLIDDKDRVKVEVKDNGIGIPQKEHDRIFDGFYNIEDVKHHHSGTIEFKAGGLGLGLTIVKHIVESNNGKVWVDSEEGKGAVFTFTIPKIM